MSLSLEQKAQIKAAMKRGQVEITAVESLKASVKAGQAAMRKYAAIHGREFRPRPKFIPVMVHNACRIIGAHWREQLQAEL